MCIKSDLCCSACRFTPGLLAEVQHRTYLRLLFKACVCCISVCTRLSGNPLPCPASSDFLHQLYEEYACAEELASLQEGEQAVTALMPHPPGAENDPDDRNVHVPAGEYHNDPDEPGGQVDDGSGEHGQHEHAMWAHDPNNQQLQQLQEVVMFPLPLLIKMS